MTRSGAKHGSPPWFGVLRAGAAVLAAVLLAGWLARQWLGGQLAEYALARSGFGPADVSVLDLGVSHATLRLVDSPVGRIERIELEYRVDRRTGIRLEDVKIEGARLRFAWRDGGLRPGSGSDGGSLRLPASRVELADSEVSFDTLAGVITAEVSGTLAGEDGIVGRLAVALRAPPGHLRGVITGELRANGAMNGDLRVDDGAFARGSARMDGLAGDLHVELRDGDVRTAVGTLSASRVELGEAALGDGHLHVTLDRSREALGLVLESTPLRVSVRTNPQPAPSGGKFEFDAMASTAFLGGFTGAFSTRDGQLAITSEGRLPPLHTWYDAVSLTLADWLQGLDMRATLRGDAASFVYPRIGDVAHASATLSLRVADGQLRCTTASGVVLDGIALRAAPATGRERSDQRSNLRITATADAPLFALVVRNGVATADLAGDLALDGMDLALHGPITASATFDPRISPAAVMRQVPLRGQLKLSTRLAVQLSPTRRASRVDLVLDGDFGFDAAGQRFVAKDATMRATDVRWDDWLAVPGTTSLTLSSGAAIEREGGTGLVTWHAELQPFSSRLKLVREGGEIIHSKLAAGRTGVESDGRATKVVLQGAGIDIEAWSLRATDLSGTLSLADGAQSFELTDATLRSTREPASFTPLHALLRASRAADIVEFSAQLRDGGGGLQARARGRHDFATGRGHADLVLEPVDLSGRDALQALSPALATRLTTTAGTLSGGGTIRWGQGASPDALAIDVRDLAITGAAFDVSGVALSLQLDNVVPPTTPDGQLLRGIAMVPGVQQVPFAATFRLAPDTVLVSQATADIFGGRCETHDAAVDVARGTGHVDLVIRDIDLRSAFEVLGLHNVSGSGRIGGVLPLRLANGRVSVAQGHLEAAGPGTLRIDAATLAEKLKTYGEDVDLVLRVLSDFHYQHLAVDADKSFAGAGTTRLRLEGSNPAVMDGHPFVFNITVETDFDKLARLLLDFASATREALGLGAGAVITH